MDHDAEVAAARQRLIDAMSKYSTNRSEETPMEVKPVPALEFLVALLAADQRLADQAAKDGLYDALNSALKTYLSDPTNKAPK